MSLAIPRPMEERASVLLPTITCSSCGAPIPLSSMGEHVCRPAPSRSNTGPVPSSSAASRPHPRPPQLAIPNSNQSGPSSFRGPVSAPAEPSPAFNRPWVNSGASSSSKTSSPASLTIPLHNPSPNSLSPHVKAPSPAFGGPSPSPRTPSPTNPFFPPQNQQPVGVMVHGLGLGVGSIGSIGGPQGPYPTDAPLPPGVQDPMASNMPHMMSGGNAGMAGVGRRAFAAAAWGVRAGVALAQGAPGAQMARGPSAPGEQTHSHPHQHPHPHPHPQEHHQRPFSPPAQQNFPQAQPHSAPHHPPQQPPRISPPAKQQTLPPSQNHQAPLLPKVSLSDRPRNPPVVAPRQPSPERTRPQHTRRESDASTTSVRSAEAERVAELLKTRAQVERQPSQKSTKPFFDRYKERMANSSGSSSPPSGTASPMMGFGEDSREGSADDDATANRRMTDDYDDEGGSALPWATPALDEPREVKPKAPKSKLHQRQITTESSSSGSSRSDRYGGTGESGGSEEVVTPSQSWEGGLSERVSNLTHRDAMRQGPSHDGLENRDYLEQIGEEDEDDEGDRVIFGAISPPPVRTKTQPIRGEAPRMNRKGSDDSRSSSDDQRDQRAPSRARTAPTSGTRAPSVASSSNSERRIKQCVKCGTTVGGSKRFVERDGVILCEKDWKKLYLPSCRRCNLPIEKSAVSSSDGQLKGKWHRACFTCTQCDQPFEGDSFYVHDGKPWCQYHYHEQNGTLCASSICRKPIEGSCILTAAPNQQRFHPGHLRCDHRGGASGAANCKESMDDYYEVGGKRYCERHANDALRLEMPDGRGRLEKRRTMLVDLPRGGLGC